ncbi:hypothetical protein K3495_g14079 [Podosphaera aphanis]|nr:hypothetical protein K3495_g14079 [Podosphaera aphanis]
MSGQQNLFPPEGLKLENNLQIENALKQKFVATGDVRYHEISESFAHIRDARRIPIRDLTLKEEVMANGSIVKIPRKFLEQSVDVVDQLTNLGYKACNQLRDCNNNWVLRGLINARIENLRKNGRRDKRKQKSSRDAKRMCRMAERTNPRAIISATQQVRSPSADDVIFVGMTPDLQSDDSPDFGLNETSYSETMDSPILASEIPEERRSFERGRTIFDSVVPESNCVGVLSSEDVEPRSEPLVPSEDDDLEEVLPRPRSLRKNPPRTEAGKSFFENEAPQAKRRKLLHNSVTDWIRSAQVWISRGSASSPFYLHNSF